MQRSKTSRCGRDHHRRRRHDGENPKNGSPDAKKSMRREPSCGEPGATAAISKQGRKVRRRRRAAPAGTEEGGMERARVEALDCGLILRNLEGLFCKNAKRRVAACGVRTEAPSALVRGNASSFFKKPYGEIPV